MLKSSYPSYLPMMPLAEHRSRSHRQIQRRGATRVALGFRAIDAGLAAAGRTPGNARVRPDQRQAVWNIASRVSANARMNWPGPVLEAASRSAMRAAKSRA